MPGRPPMRSPGVIMTALVGAALVAGTAAGGPDDRNAAMWYRRAFERLGALTEADWAVLNLAAADPTAPPSPALRAVMARATPILELARRGSLRAHADFELDRSLGFDLTLPHLGPLRSIARLMKHDVRIRIQDGDAAGAADRLAAMYRMSGHLSGEGIIISALVGQSIFRLGEDAADAGFGRGAFGAAEGAVLLRALDGLDGPDPFGSLAAVEGERTILVDWMARRFGAEEDRAALLVDGGFWFGGGDAAFRLAGMTDEEFSAEIDRYDSGMAEIAAVFSLESRDAALAELARIEEEVQDGAFGLIAKLLTPALSRLYEQTGQTRDMIAARRSVLAGIASGDVDPAALANAAFLYLEAEVRLLALDEADLAALRAAADGDEPAQDGSLTRALRAVDPVVDLLREASALERCDFSAIRSGGTIALVPSPLAGLRDAFRVLHAGARRRLDAADAAGACDRLGICLGIVAHLSTDDTLLASLVGHRAFVTTGVLVERSLAAGVLSDGQREQLRAAAARIARADPFAYHRAMKRTRGWLTGSLVRQCAADEGGSRLIDELTQAAEAWDGDQLLYLVAVYDHLARGAAAAGRTGDIDRRAGLNDVLSPRALDAVAAAIGPAASAMSLCDLDFLSDPDLPIIGRVEAGRRAAAGDLRRGLARFGIGAPLRRDRPAASTRRPGPP